MLWQTGGAQAGIEDVGGGNPGGSEMAAVGFGQIDVLLAIDGRPFGKERAEVCGDLGSDLIAALADARAEGSVNISRV